MQTQPSYQTQHAQQQPRGIRMAADPAERRWAAGRQLVTAGVDQLPVRYLRRTDRFAGAAADAIIQVPACRIGDFQTAAGHTLQQCDPASRRFALQTGEPVGGAVRQAQTALDALVGQCGDGLR